MATDSSILAWEIPWAEEPWRATEHGVAKSWTRLSTAHSTAYAGVAKGEKLAFIGLALISSVLFLSVP